MRDASTLKESFGSDDYRFITASLGRLQAMEGLESKDYPHLVKIWSQRDDLPDLSGAPIASWWLARQAHMNGSHFPYSYDEVTGSDGANYWLFYLILSPPAEAVGKLFCQGSDRECSIHISCREGHDHDTIFTTFENCLFDLPDVISPCRVIVQYTEITDPEVAFHIPRAYGWDGEKYLDEVCPEHAVNPEEYE